MKIIGLLLFVEMAFVYGWGALAQMRRGEKIKAAIQGFWLAVLVTMVACLLTGCATRGYVDRRDTETLKQAEHSARLERIGVIEYASTIEDDLTALKRDMMRGTEVRAAMHRDRWLSELESLERELERVRQMILPTK